MAPVYELEKSSFLSRLHILRKYIYTQFQNYETGIVLSSDKTETFAIFLEI